MRASPSSTRPPAPRSVTSPAPASTRSTRRSPAPCARSGRGRHCRRSRAPMRCGRSPASSRARVEELAQLEVLNSGHPIGSARWEAGHVAQVLNYYAGAPERLSGQQIPVAGGLDVTFHEPYGVVGIIVPWNFPMTIAVVGLRARARRRQRGGAQARRAHAAHRDASRRARASRRACPRGSSRSSPGRDRSSVSGSSRIRTCARSSSPGRPRSARMSRPAARARSSRSRSNSAARARTSSSPTRTSNAPRPPRPARCSTTPARTAAPAAASSCSARSTTGSSSCSSPPSPRGGSATRTTRPPTWGRSSRPRTATPSPRSSTARRRVPRHGAGRAGLLVRSRGRAADSPDDRIAQQEVFGPVVAVLPFDDEADAIRLANDTMYGLAGSIWTENLGRAVRVSRGVQSGVLSVNSHSSVRYRTPFGGMKASGPRPRARSGRRRALHRDQERLLRDGGLMHRLLPALHPAGTP